MNGKKPTFGSVCDGIGCGHLAFEREGYDCLWSAEIDAFPSAVLKERFPHVRNVGNMKKIRGKLKEAFIKAPDVFIGGTPCQSWSIAGKRKGLDDERGNLSLEFCRIADGIDAVRFAAGKDGCVVCWENVPGLLSDKGNGFGCILGMLAGEDEAIDVKKWPRAGVVCGTRRRVAWCILDSQYFGVAQRRRRVFVVAVPNQLIERLGTRADPAEILSIGYGSRRDTPTRQGSGKGVAGDAGKRVEGGNSEAHGFNFEMFSGECGPVSPALQALRAKDTLCYDVPDVANCLQTTCNDYSRADGFNMVVEPPQALYENHANDSRVTGPHDVSPMLSAKMGTGGGNVPPVGPGAIAFERRMVRTSGGQPSEELCGCLRADENTGDGAPCVAIQGNLVGRVEGGPDGVGASEDGSMYTLTKQDVHCVAFTTEQTPKASKELAMTLTKGSPSGGGQPQCVAIADVLHGDKACNGKGWNDDGSAYTLDTMATQGVCVGAFKGGQGAKAGSIGFSEHVSPTLSSADSGSNRVPVVAQGVCTAIAINTKQQSQNIGMDVANSIGANDYKEPQAVMHTSTVRRLLVTECEILQGLPRGWTLIPWRGKPAADCPDGPRYKGIGNGQTVQVMQWLAMRIRNAITE